MKDVMENRPWLDRLKRLQGVAPLSEPTKKTPKCTGYSSAESAKTQETPGEGISSDTPETESLPLCCPLCGRSDSIKDYHDEDNHARFDYICDPCGMLVAEVWPPTPTDMSGA